MQDQERQPTHGNDRIAAVIGPGWQQKHRSFRHFFATQDHMIGVDGEFIRVHETLL
jgi:hypothetical protein